MTRKENYIGILAKTQSGASAVEFALIAPVFVLILFGMIAYGIYFGAAHSVQQIAADAARSSIAGLNVAERQQLAAGFVKNNADEYAFVDPAKVLVVVADSAKDHNQFDVTVTFDADALPIWNILPGVLMPSSTIERSSTIRIGGI